MLESQRIHLRLFLEGIEVPVISASVTSSIGSAASATVQIPGHDSALYILPKTMVHVFYYDWEYDHLSGDGTGPYTEGVGQTLQTPSTTKSGKATFSTRVDQNYKLLFCGEVISLNFSKDGFGSQTITLACSDCSSVLDTAYLFQTQYHSSTAGLINQDVGFYGSNGNPFDDIISTPERVVADFIKQNKPKNPALRGDTKTIVGGLFAFFEVLLGVHGYSYGLDTFFTIQERRLRLMEQIVSDTGEVAAELFDAQVFENWVSNKIGGTPAVMSFREVSQMIMNYVFYQQVPIPVGIYRYGARDVPEYDSDYTDRFSEYAEKLGRGSSGKAASNFMKLDAEFAKAALEVLNRVNELSIVFDKVLGKGYVETSSSEEGSEDSEGIVRIKPSAFFSGTFRDYQKRADLAGIDVEDAKKVAHNYAHDQGLAVDISSGISPGWSLPDDLKHVRNKATYWSFLGVKGKDADYWCNKGLHKADGFKAMMYTTKVADQSFTTAEEFQDYLILQYETYMDTIDNYDPAKFTSLVTKDDGSTVTDPVSIREAIDKEDNTSFKFLDFWIKNADKARMRESGIELIKATIIVAKEIYLFYELLGQAVEYVNSQGKYDELDWGGNWTSGEDILNLINLFGNGTVGWDPCHVESERFTGKMLRDPKILNDGWETRNKDAENYTPSVQDIIEANEAQAGQEALPGEDSTTLEKIYAEGALPGNYGREQLITQVFRPDVWFCPPPVCNNIFPEEYSSLTFSRPMMREVTRLKLTSYHQLMEDVVVNKYYFAPQFEGIENLEQKGIGEVAKTVLYPHEIYTGIIPKIQKLNEASFYTKAGAQIQSDVNDLNQKITYDEGQSDPAETASASDEFTSLLQSYGARVAHFHLLTARYASRSGSVMGRFMPRLVAGFPGAIYQKTFNNTASVSTALGMGLSDYTSESAKEIFNKTKPIHYQCMIQSVTHTISQQQANTSVSFTHARSHKTDSATDDLLSTMAESGGFKLDSAAVGSDAESKTFETISIDKSSTYSSTSAFFTICKELYSDLFDQNDSIDLKLFKLSDKVFKNIVSARTYEVTKAHEEAFATPPPKGVTNPDSRSVARAGAAPNDSNHTGLFSYKVPFQEGKAYYFSDNGRTFLLSNIQYEGVELGNIYTAQEGQSEYIVEDGKSLFTVDVLSSFEKVLAWETAVYIKVPITNSDPLVSDNYEVNGGKLYKKYSGNTQEWTEINISPSELFSREGASIVTGTLSSTVGGEGVVYYEYINNTDDGGWEGYLYVKIKPKFNTIKVFYGEISETSDTASTTGEKEPWEVSIRPGWFSKAAYSNTTIGDTYMRMFGCTSVISKYPGLSPIDGYSTVSTEQAMDRVIADYSSQSDPIRWIHKNCSRGDANLIQVLGKKERGREDEYSSGGFHSSAVGSFSKLEGLDITGRDLKSLLDPSLKKIQINAGDQKLDPRQSRRNAILYYLSTILSRGIRS